MPKSPTGIRKKSFCFVLPPQRVGWGQGKTTKLKILFFNEKHLFFSDMSANEGGGSTPCPQLK